MPRPGIEHLAFHDPLTGLCNRVELHNRLEQAVQQAKRRSRSLALHFIDLDRFKVVNDTLGHSVGDSVLQAVATRLAGCLRESDTAARRRIGGDRFRSLADPSWPTRRARRRSPVGSSAEWRTRFGFAATTFTFRLASASVSIPLDSSEAGRAVEKHRHGDVLGRGTEGRNNFQFFTSALNDQLRDRQDLESDLHTALGQRRVRAPFSAAGEFANSPPDRMERYSLESPHAWAGAAEHVYRDCGRMWADSEMGQIGCQEQACTRMPHGRPPNCLAAGSPSMFLRQISNGATCARLSRTS